MKRILYLMLSVLFLSCNEGSENTDETLVDSVDVVMKPIEDPGPSAQESDYQDTASTRPVYANQRFRNVIVKRTGDSSFQVNGEGQIFEASFNWVIEDGHNELKKGYEMTDAGAPEWGKFSFTVTAAKQRPNSTLHLIIFETSAKDGSRVHELPIPLY